MSIRALVLLLGLWPCLLSAQEGGLADPAAEKQVIDSLWGMVQSDPGSSLGSAAALLERSQRSGSYKGAMNAEQLIGESHYMLGHIDSALFWYKKALLRAEAKPDSNEIANNHTSLGTILSGTGEADEAIMHLEKALAIRLAGKNDAYICEMNMRLANALVHFDRLDRAMGYFTKGIKACTAAGDTEYVAEGYHGMSLVRKKQHDLVGALALQDSAMAIYGAGKRSYFMGALLNNRGILLKDLGRYDEAMASYAEGLDIMREIGYPRGIMSYSINLALLHNIKNEPEAALALCREAYAIAQRNSLPTAASDALHEMAVAYLTKGRLDAAKDSIESSLRLAREGHSLENEHQAWSTKSKILKAQGRPDLALDAYEHYVTLHDSIFNTDRTAEIERLKTAFDTEQKEKDIAHLKAESKLSAERQRWLHIGIAALAIAALAIVIALVQRQRKQKLVHAAKLRQHEAEKRLINEQLEHKKRELTSQALHLAQKNELLHTVQADLKELELTANGTAGDLRRVGGKIRFDRQIDENWEQFTMAFTETNREFFQRLSTKHPNVSKNELRLAALVSMNLSSKELGTILNISEEGVKKARYRLRKKLGLATEEGLEQYLVSL